MNKQIVFLLRYYTLWHKLSFSLYKFVTWCRRGLGFVSQLKIVVMLAAAHQALRFPPQKSFTYNLLYFSSVQPTTSADLLRVHTRLL